MGTITKLCGLVGFVGLFGILTASCATAEAPTGTPDSDGDLGVSTAALVRQTCSASCADNTFVSVYVEANDPPQAYAIATAKVKDACKGHGGWDDYYGKWYGCVNQ